MRQECKDICSQVARVVYNPETKQNLITERPKERIKYGTDILSLPLIKMTA